MQVGIGVPEQLRDGPLAERFQFVVRRRPLADVTADDTGGVISGEAGEGVEASRGPEGRDRGGEREVDPILQ